MDILGFKDMVSREPHEKVLEILHSVTNIRQELFGIVNLYKDVFEFSNSVPKIRQEPFVIDDLYTKELEIKDSDIHSICFSDSIIIFSNNDNDSSFYLFLIIVNHIFASIIDSGIPVKGAIAHGKISIDRGKQLYFGQPLIDAHLLHDQVKYLGIVCHHTIDKYLKNIDVTDHLSALRSILIEFESPLKEGDITHFNLEYFSFCPSFFKSSDAVSFINNLINSFKLSCSGNVRKYVDNTLKVLVKFPCYKNNIPSPKSIIP